MSSLIQSELAGEVRGPSYSEVWSRMELEFELARARSAPTGMVRLAVERLERQPEPRRARILAAIGGLVRTRTPRATLFAALREHELVVLLPGSDLAETEGFARVLVAEARKLAVPDESTPLRVSLASGVAATRPGLDLYFEALAAVASEGVEVASRQGGECCVHSELYDLHQRRVERTKGTRASIPAPSAQPVYHNQATPPRAQAIPPAATNGGRAVSTPALEAHLREVLPAAGPVPGLDLEQMEAKVLELARATFERALGEQQQRFESELDLYQRRLAKMQRTLAQTEDERDRLARGGLVDTGIASTYRDVQGLSGEDPDARHRIGLLRQIAEANVMLHAELQKKTA